MVARTETNIRTSPEKYVGTVGGTDNGIRIYWYGTRFAFHGMVFLEWYDVRISLVRYVVRFFWSE